MPDPWVLTWSGGSLTIDTFTPSGLEFGAQPYGEAVSVIGRMRPLGHTLGTSGRKGTLTHIVKQPSGEPYATYDAMHAALEAIYASLNNPEVPTSYGTLSGPGVSSITVRIIGAHFQERLPPHVPFGVVTISYEEVTP